MPKGNLTIGTTPEALPKCPLSASGVRRLLKKPIT